MIQRNTFASGHENSPFEFERVETAAQLSQETQQVVRVLTQQSLSHPEGMKGALFEFIEKYDLLAPLTVLQEAVRQVYSLLGEPIPSHLDPNALQNFDPSEPVMRKIDDISEFQIANRDAYTNVRGERFKGPNNLYLQIQKPGKNGELFTQTFMFPANHGEVVAQIVYWVLHLCTDDPKEGLRLLESGGISVLQFDGHADEIGSNDMPDIDEFKAKMTEGKEAANTIFALQTEFDRRGGIATHVPLSMLIGAVKNVLLKTIPESWNAQEVDGKNDGYVYPIAHRVTAGHEPNDTMQMDIEPESGLRPDKAVAEDSSIVAANGDADFWYYCETPHDIATALRQKIEMTKYKKLVIMNTSPGWMDQDLAILYFKLEFEIQQPEVNSSAIKGYLEQMYDKLSELGSQGLSNINGKPTLYQSFAEAQPQQKQVDLDEMFTILTTDNFTWPVDANEDNFRTTHYYDERGTVGERKNISPVITKLETDQKLIPALRSSRAPNLRLLADRFDALSPITDEEILRYVADNAIEPAANEKLSRAKQSDDPVGYALSNLLRDTQENFVNYSPDVIIERLELILRILKEESMVTSTPLATKHSMLCLFNRLGMETRLFDYRFSNFKVHLGQTGNWSSRPISNNTAFSDATIEDGPGEKVDEGVITIRDASSILKVSGGGTVNVEVKHEGEADTIPFSFKLGQDICQRLTHAYVNGFLHRKEDGTVVLPQSDEEAANLIKWEVVDRNTAATKRVNSMQKVIRDTWVIDDGVDSPEANPAFKVLKEFSSKLVPARLSIKTPTFSDKGKYLYSECRTVVETAHRFYLATQSWNASEASNLFQLLHSQLQTIESDHPVEMDDFVNFVQKEQETIKRSLEVIARMLSEEIATT